VNLTDGGIQIGNGNVNLDLANVPNTNGVVHVMDEVLVNDDIVAALPSDNIVELAVANEDLSTLVSVLSEYPDLLELLAGDGESGYTVFAPTNAAFAAIEDIVAELDEDSLRDILLYHVAPTVRYSSSLADGDRIATALDRSVTVDTTGGVFINDAEVAIPDVAAANGVVHVVDSVLIPPPHSHDDDEGLSDGAIVGIVIGCIAGLVLVGLAVANTREEEKSDLTQPLSSV
jgi:transforming growth factor-beta-induced protein